MNARLKSLIHFLDDGIWRIREEEVSHLQWKAYTCLKIIYLSINQFINDLYKEADVVDHRYKF